MLVFTRRFLRTGRLCASPGLIENTPDRPATRTLRFLRDPWIQVPRVFMEINGSVRHYHINTALGNRIMDHYRRQATELNPDFIAMLKLHHGMEE